MATSSKAKTAASAKAAPAATVESSVAKAAKPAVKAAVSAAPVLSMNSGKKYAGLTEAELLKQPESDYMNKAQLAFFREKLIEVRDNILHNATDTGEHLRDTEVATDPSDRATQEEEFNLELRTRDRERKLIRKIDQALVGNSAGQQFLRLTFSLPDRATHVITDPEDSTSKTYARYLWEFWLRRKVDGEAFNVVHPRTGTNLLCVFAERRLTLHAVTRKCYTTGLRFKQYRTS